jgi:amino acid transporter
LCNDKAVLGPWVNRPWLNVLATVIVSILLMMSFILMITTVFTHVNVTTLVEVMGAILVVTLGIAGIVFWRLRRRTPAEPISKELRATWRMPPLNLVDRPTWSKSRLYAMYALRVYLVVAVLLLLVKAIQIG